LGVVCLRKITPFSGGGGKSPLVMVDRYGGEGLNRAIFYGSELVYGVSFV